MNRSDFLKTIGLGAVAGSLKGRAEKAPEKPSEPVKQPIGDNMGYDEFTYLNRIRELEKELGQEPKGRVDQEPFFRHTNVFSHKDARLGR